MNWFKRHLNWTAVFIGIAWNILILLRGIEGLLGIIVFFPLFGWALHRKNRSMWWVLLLFIPLGWLVYIWLDDRREIWDIRGGALTKVRAKEGTDDEPV